MQNKFCSPLRLLTLASSCFGFAIQLWLPPSLELEEGVKPSMPLRTGKSLTYLFFWQWNRFSGLYARGLLPNKTVSKLTRMMYSVGLGLGLGLAQRAKNHKMSSNHFCPYVKIKIWGFSEAQMVKNLCSMWETRFDSWLGRSPGEGNGYALQYSGLENSMDRGACWASVRGVANSWTRLSD